MNTYEITDPKTGLTIELTGDVPPSGETIRKAFSSIPQEELPQAEPQGLAGKAWDALAVPERKSKEGLQMIAGLVSPKVETTGNLARDVAMNLPRIGMETLAEAAPGFISRGSILTAGALKGLQAAAPAIRAVGRGVAKGAESISGLEYKTPGVLKEAFNNPGLLLAPGKAKAEYEAAKALGGEIRPSLLNTSSKLKFIEKAKDLADKGKLTASEALEARKELSAIKKQVTGEFFRKTTDKFNEIAKPVFGEADKAYRQGLKADALRAIFPVNKGGGTSIAKSVGGVLAGSAGSLTGGMTTLPMLAMSPVVQGAAASGAGLAAKAAAPIINNPVISAAAAETLKQAAPILKDLTREIAVKFIKKAKGDKRLAAQMAEAQGYNTERIVGE